MPTTRLPRRRRPGRLPALLAPSPSVRRVLLADPDARRRAVLTTLLQTDGHPTEAVPGRKALLSRLRAAPPDVLLVAADLGLETVTDVRARDPLRRVPLVVYAGEEQDEDHVVQALLAGADDFLTFSHRVAEFGARIAVQLRNRRDRELLAWATAKMGELNESAQLDPLTGIPNRRVADAALADALASGNPVVLALVDLDHFKIVNDTCGHPAGDAVLKATAAALEKGARREDVVARFGGEEFIVVVRDAKPSVSVAIGERLRGAVGGLRFPADLGVLRVTASVGVGWWDGTPPAPAAAALVELTDHALYAAKHRGRDRVVVVGWVADGTTRRDAG